MTVGEGIRNFIFNELIEGEPGGDPVADGRLDSLALEQVIGFIEDEYDVTFTDDDLVRENFASLDSVVALVESKRQQQSAS